MPSRRDIFLGSDFDDASQFPPIFRWKTCRQHAQGLNIARIQGGRKRRRAILRQWQSVHHELHVVFRTARVKHAIGFIQPTRLFGYQVQQFAPRLRRVMFLDRLPADGVQRSRRIGVHQGRRIVHLHLCCHRRNAQRDGHTHRHLGAYFDQIAPRRESFRLQTQPVNSKRKILRNVAPLRPRHKCPPKPIGFADELARWRHRSPMRVIHLNPQFAAHALCPRAHRAQEHQRNGSHCPYSVPREHLC